MPKARCTKKTRSVPHHPRGLPTLTCATCGLEKRSDYFYSSFSSLHKSTGKLPYCKDCIQKMARNNDGEVVTSKFMAMLKTIDRPFISQVYEKSLQDNHKNVVGVYLRMLCMSQYKNLKWIDGEINPETKVETVKEQEFKNNIVREFQFEVTDEIRNMFGDGYDIKEYKAMWEKYKELSENYLEKTSMHREALITYIRLKVKEEMAIAKGDVGNAKTWSELANKAAQNAKITPGQLSQADLQGGLNTFSELATAAESAADIIKVLPEFKYSPRDSVDFGIWCYINYARELQGLPVVEYKEIYSFYDKMKEKYISEYGDPEGIFADDTTERNRPLIEHFISTEESGDE